MWQYIHRLTDEHIGLIDEYTDSYRSSGFLSHVHYVASHFAKKFEPTPPPSVPPLLAPLAPGAMHPAPPAPDAGPYAARLAPHGPLHCWPGLDAARLRPTDLEAANIIPIASPAALPCVVCRAPSSPSMSWHQCCPLRAGVSCSRVDVPPRA
jgi:hypothetical protein